MAAPEATRDRIRLTGELTPLDPYSSVPGESRFPDMRQTLVFISIALLALGCTVTRGSGVVATDQRELSGFDRITVSGSATVDVGIGSEWSVVVEADDNLLPIIETTVRGSTLDIGTKSGVSFLTSNPVRVSITMPALQGVDISGSGRLSAPGIGDSQQLTVDVSGSGQASVSGSAEQLDVTVSGSGEFDGRQFQTARATVSISGSGGAIIWATERLDATVSGSGKVRYVGNPGQLSTDVSGSGSVTGDG